jgi:predicted phosphodiesterase
MPILVLSDIHANLTALEAVIQDAGKVEAVWCLGDVVGYGPDPNECITLVRRIPNLICLLGNHDAAAVNLISDYGFNPEARDSLEWTQNALSAKSRKFLEDLPESVVGNSVTLVHGSPRAPILEYLLDNFAAAENFAYFDTDYCFVGHSHLPVMFHHTGDNVLAHLAVLSEPQTCPMTPRLILNPGSVGQPRDRDPRAAYALYDPQNSTWQARRVAYDVAAVQARMRTAGLPDRHIARLATGW